MKPMKISIYKIKNIVAVLAGVSLAACQDTDYAEPNVTTNTTSSSAFVVMANASPDAPTLDFYVNNVKVGESVEPQESQDTYTKVPVVSNGVLANTNVRVKAASGSIGGTLGSNDLIFRASNNNTNNFQAVDSGYYTFIVVDTISRPKPLRTLNVGNFGDTTYFNTLTGKYISVVERAALTAEAKSKLVAIGTVPLGSSDPGGLRFLVITDQLPLPSTTRLPKPAANKVSVRFVNASPDAGSATAKANATAITSAISSFPMRFPTFSPSVGSRSTTLNFQTIDAGVYDLTATIGATVVTLSAQDLVGGSVYTIILSGKQSDGSLSLTVIKNK
jgi:hypothetical protein